MTISTYKSLLTGKNIMVVASIGKFGYKDYRESQVMFRNGMYHYNITDGHFVLKSGTFPASKGLKSILNILEGKLKLMK